MAHVHRIHADGRTVTMTRGLSGETYQEPRFRALVYDDSGRCCGSADNVTHLCLPGSSAIRAPLATDDQIIEAVLHDEPIFDY